LERPPVDEQQCIDRMQAQVDRLDKKFTDFTEQANSRLRALQGSLVVQECADKVKDRAEQVRKVTDNLKALPELEWNLDAIDIRQDLVDVIKIGMDENQEPVDELKAVVDDLHGCFLKMSYFGQKITFWRQTGYFKWFLGENVTVKSFLVRNGHFKTFLGRKR
jgi:hypothetical protein